MNNSTTTAERGSNFSSPSPIRDTDFVEQFRAAMLDHGLDVASAAIVPDGKEHRYDADGDRKGTKNGWGALHTEGDQAWGGFGDWKRGTSIPWSAKGAKAPSKAQRKAMDARIAVAKAADKAEREAAYAAAAERAREVFDGASPADTSHPYLERKRVGAHGLHVGVWEFIEEGTGEVRAVPNALMAPIYRKVDGKGVISSIEGILPDGSKYGFKGGQKADGYHVIGRPQIVDGREVFLLAEGYSTAAALHEATGHCAIMTFTAGNLPSIAKQVRDGKPDADIVIFSDRDAEELDNSVGTRKAVEAALAVGARLVVPEWTGQKGRDANDIWVDGFSHEWVDGEGKRQSMHIAGLEHLRGCVKFATPCRSPSFMELLRECGISERDLTPVQAEAVPIADAGPGPGPVVEADDGDPEDDTAPGENPFANNRHFRVLGVDEDAYFFFRKGKRNQILTIRTSGLSKNALMSLAPLNWWESIMLGTASGKFDKDAAVGSLMEAAESAGIYDPTFTRGRGAWWDEDRLVVHLGDRLLIDGKQTDLGAIRSEFLYQGGRKIGAPSETPLSATEGAWLLDIATSFRWAKPASAPLLCGWLLLSPLCGALRWRPHAWVSGGPGSGKTTILNEFVRPLIPAGMDVFANGDSTEAGLRQTLRSDARPILIDESESDTEAAATKMQRILVMIRQSSSDTGAQTYRGTVGGEAQAFQVRSMALLSSIGVALERQQDLERVTVLALRPKRESEATDVKKWPAIRSGLNKIAKDKTLNARLFRRSIDMGAIVMEAIDIFTEAAATFFGTAREGDQIGALLAGAWCLVNDRLPTQEEALAEIKRYDWVDYQEGKAEEQDDLIATLMGRPITRQGGVRTSVGKLVARAAGYAVEELDILPNVADSELHNFGMKVKDGYLWFHPKNAELLKLMRETKFSSDLRGRLKRIQAADTKDAIRIGEAATSGILIPLSAALSHRDSDDRTF